MEDLLSLFSMRALTISISSLNFLTFGVIRDGRPSFIPEILLIARASFVLWDMRLRSISDACLSADSFGFEHLSASVSYGIWAPQNSNNKLMGFNAGMNFGKNFSARIKAAHISDRESGTLYNEYGASVGEYKGADLRVEAGVGAKILPFLAADINIRMLNSKPCPSLSSNVFTADANVVYRKDLWSASLGIRNLGALPSYSTAGVGYYSQLLKAEAEFDYYFSGHIAASLGGEFNIKDLVFLRAGYRYAGKSAPLPSFASAGFGLKLFGASLEGCYLFASPTLGGTMMFSFAYDF